MNVMDVLWPNIIGSIIDEGMLPGEASLDERRAQERQAAYGYNLPVFGVLCKAGVIVRGEGLGEFFVDKEKVLRISPYVADRLADAPRMIRLNRAVGMAPAPQR